MDNGAIPDDYDTWANESQMDNVHPIRGADFFADAIPPDSLALSNRSTRKNKAPFVPFGGDTQATFQKIEWQEKPAPTFDYQMLPRVFANYVKDAANNIPVAPEQIAVPLMVALSGVVGRRFAIHPKQKSNWKVIPNLWGGVINRPSTKKSASISAGCFALEALERDAREEYQKAIAEYELDAEVHDIAIKAAKKEAKDAGTDKQAIKAALMQTGSDDNQPREPIQRRYKANDATIEKIADLMTTNPHGLTLISDELAGWIASMNSEHKAGEREKYLEMWNGDTSINIDRMMRGSSYIEGACLAVIGGIQPAKIKPVIREAVSNSVRDDGFLQRFQLLVYPDKNPTGYVDDYENGAAKSRVLRLFNELTDFGGDKPVSLRFAEDAQPLFVEWYTANERESRAGNVSEAIESHLSKYASLIPSLALLIHLADAESNHSRQQPVTREALEKAILWGDYLKGHMHRIYGMVEDDSYQNAVMIARKFGDKLQGSFTLRDITQPAWRGIGRDKAKAAEAIEILVEHGYIFENKRETAGRHTTDYSINPDVVGIH